MPSTATASASPPATIDSALPSSFSTFSVGVRSPSGTGSGASGGRQLRHSSSFANARPSSASNSPRERRRPSLSVSPSSFHASSLSPDSYSFKSRKPAASPSTSLMSPPPSPPPPNSRLEEHYLAAKRRAHRQSYFDHYPERNSPHLREERKVATDELDELVNAQKAPLSKGKERAETLHGLRPEVVADAKQETIAGPSEWKTRLTASSSMHKMETGSLGRPVDSCECDFLGQIAMPAAPPRRPPRSAKRATMHAPIHSPPQAAAETTTTNPNTTTIRLKTERPTSSASAKAVGRVPRTPKIPTHPYGAFRGEGCPDLRMSNSTYSSSQTHRGSPSPPQTPIEAHSQHSSYEPIEVMVAPDFDVEAMDALVEGMDGSSDDDLFKRLQRTVAKSDFGSRHSPCGHQHHPLYAPPLPEPPEGVVLGRVPDGLRIDSINGLGTEHEPYAVEGEDGALADAMVRPTSLGERPFPSVSDKEKNREKSGRTASSSTIVADMVSHSSSQTMIMKEPPKALLQVAKEIPLSIDEIILKHTSKPAHIPSYQRPSTSPLPDPSSSTYASASTPMERTNTVRASPDVPSISDIIQKHKPLNAHPSYPRPHSSAASSASVHVGQQRRPVLVPQHQASWTSDSEMEVPDSADTSRSGGLTTSNSADSISAEARRVILSGSVQSSNASFSRSGEGAPSLDRRHSTYSGKFAFTSRSTTGGGKASSVRSGSASASISKGTTHTSDNILSELDILSGLSANLAGGSATGGGGKKKQSAQRDAVATYLRSARITTLLKLMRRPHAAPDRPLNVSVSDLGKKTGLPLVVFLGLGCVRHVMGLYDEMAECMGLRLITIDRWGLGRTDVPPTSSSRGVLEWATVVDEVLEQLNIGKCSVMAHSAGAPYALAFSNKYPSRIVGDVCLLAPWVGGGAAGGYGWLKYVPNGILKTAQAAEWKIQAWMLGKPPKITYEGIGYNMNAPVSSDIFEEAEHIGQDTGARGAFDVGYAESGSESGYDEELDELDLRPDEMGLKIKPLDTATSMANDPYRSAAQTQATHSGSLISRSRPSTSSGNTLAEYDDLADFGGRFSSRSFERRRSLANDANDQGGIGFSAGKKKKGFLKRWKGAAHSNAGISNTSPPPVPPVPAILSGIRAAQASGGSSLTVSPAHVPTDPAAQGGGKSKLRTLRSIGSLRNRNGNGSSIVPTTSPKVGELSPVLPEQDFSVALDFNLALDEFGRGDGKESNAIPPVADASLSRKSTERRDLMNSRRSTMYGEPSEMEVHSELKGGPLPASSSRANGRRSISMSAARPNTAATSRTAGAATISGRSHHREPSIPDPLNALSSATSSNSIKTTPSKRTNKLRRRRSAAPSTDTFSISQAHSPTSASSVSYQVELGNALIAASHAESSRGTHPDLLQILNHERRPWGFSYARYPHPVQVWYGDRDERIARESVEWMREKMCAKDAVAAGGDGRCEVKVVKGADHGLMFRTDVVVEVLEHVQAMWNAESASLAQGVDQESVSMHSLSGKLNLSPRKTTNRPRPSEKGTLRASWGYELHNDPFRAS